MDDKLTEIHNTIPIDAKLEPLSRELGGIIKGRWSDLTSQQRKALEAARAGVDVAIKAIRDERARRVRAHAAEGQLEARRGFRVVREEI